MQRTKPRSAQASDLSRLPRRRRRLRRALGGLFAATSLLLALEAGAAVLLDDLFGGVTPVSDSELANIRGGFTTPSGLEINFGVTVQTFLDGVLALQSVFTSGSSHHSSHGSHVTGQTTVTIDGDPQTFDLEDGLHIEVFANGGLTQVIQDIGDDHILTVIQNQASGVDILQVTTLDITIENALDQFTNSLGAAALPILNLINGTLIDSLP